MFHGDDVTLAQVMGTVLAAIVFFGMGILRPELQVDRLPARRSCAGSRRRGSRCRCGDRVAPAWADAAVMAAGGASSAVKAGASMAGAAHLLHARFRALAHQAQRVWPQVSRYCPRKRDAMRRGIPPAQAQRRLSPRQSGCLARDRRFANCIHAALPPILIAKPGWVRGTSQRVGQAGQMAAHRSATAIAALRARTPP